MSDRWGRFFTWVWRVNGLLLLGLALSGVALALALALNIGVFASHERPEQQLSEVAGADLGAQGLRLADFEPIVGTQLLYAALAPPSEYIGSGSSGGLGQARNLLFFDTVSKKAHWLLPNNDRTITSFSFLMDPPGARYAYDLGSSSEKKQVAIALLFETRDGAPGKTAPRTLAIAAPDGRASAPIAESTQGLLGYHHARRDSLFVFYVSSGAAKVLDVDPIARRVRSDTPLATEE